MPAKKYEERIKVRKQQQAIYRTVNRQKLNEDERKRRAKNPQRIKEQKRKWNSLNPEKYLLMVTKHSATKLGLDFNLELCDMIIPTMCPVLEIPLFRIHDKRTDNSPSVDRIDSTKGYVKGNIQIISWRANRIKNDATPKELMTIALYMLNLTCQ